MEQKANNCIDMHSDDIAISVRNLTKTWRTSRQIGLADAGHAEQGDLLVLPGAEGCGAEFHRLEA